MGYVFFSFLLTCVLCEISKSRIRYPSQMMVSSSCWVGLRHLGREMQSWIAFHYSQASATARCIEFSIFMYFELFSAYCFFLASEQWSASWTSLRNRTLHAETFANSNRFSPGHRAAAFSVGALIF